MPLQVAFAGTPAFAALALAAIARAGLTIPLVLTRPDKPKGRGLGMSSSEVSQQAQALGLPTRKPPSLKSADASSSVTSVPVDVLVVAAYGLILPRHVLDWPRHGCLNIHASLLPRWRGAAPIQRAIEAGDGRTGISIMQMDEGLDTGPVISQHPVSIDVTETAGTLHAKLAEIGAAAIVEALQTLGRDGGLAARPQPTEGATYATKIGAADAAIDWTRDAASIDRKVRAYDPVPGASTALDGVRVKIWRAEPRQASVDGHPGVAVLEGDALVVACGAGTLAVTELQPAGGKRMSARAFAAGRSGASLRFAASATG